MSSLDRVFEKGAAAGMDPIAIFADWFAAARESERPNPDAACLATASPDGTPTARMVLVRAFDPRGFVFYTNIESQKGAELARNPQAALCFYWKTLDRQVRVQGQVEPVAAEQADGYFANRDRASQISAWASDQSRPLPRRAVLERAVNELEARYGDRDIPRPRHWSGFRVLPGRIEFWRGQDSRRHDRMLFTRAAGGWHPQRLYP